MRLVEVIKSDHTDPAVFDQMLAFGKSIGVDIVNNPDWWTNYKVQ
jgi:3-hydroxyacyl-CoA dehydrogenase